MSQTPIWFIAIVSIFTVDHIVFFKLFEMVINNSFGKIAGRYD